MEVIDNVFSLEEGRDILKCSTWWLLEGARTGELPSHKLGGKLVFTASDLTEILEICSRPRKVS
jgi:hypothetical protein